MPGESLSVLSEAVNALTEQHRILLSQMAVAVQPRWDALDARFLELLAERGYDLAQRKALAAITAGAAARFLGRGSSHAEFLEEVSYQGRRLAKLNLSPSDTAGALAEYDRLLAPVLKRRAGEDSVRLEAAREQLHFSTLLTLNSAYYQVRSDETQAFHEMFWAELESRKLDDLLGRFLAILARVCRADQAQFYLEDAETGEFVQRACHKARTSGLRAAPSKALSAPAAFVPGDRGKGHRGVALDPSWSGRFESVWSVPLLSGKRAVGVIQFAFAKTYDWLPREQELLEIAAERCRMAIDKQRMVEHLDRQQRQIRELAEGMLHVEEAERRRISRELHDQTGQDLLWIRLQMEMIEQDLPEDGRRLRTRLGEVRDMTEKTIVEIRRLIGALSPAVLEQLGLAAALRQLVNRFRQAHTSRVKLEFGRLPELPKQLEVIAYRLIQECLNNVAKHSFCSNVIISLSSADGRLCLRVEDDGVGFQLEEALTKPGSFGLAGIQERVALLGGRCEMVSAPLDPRPALASKRPRPPGSVHPVPKGGRKRSEAREFSSGTKIFVELPVSKDGDPKAPAVEANPARTASGRNALAAASS